MGWLDRVLYGVDLDAEAARTKDLQAWQDRLDNAPRMQSVWTPEDFIAHEQQLAAEQSGGLDPATYDSQVYAAAGQGAVEGLQATADTARGAITATAGTVIPGLINTVFRFLPWWVWLAGGVYFAAQAGWLVPAGKFAFAKGKAWLTK